MKKGILIVNLILFVVVAAIYVHFSSSNEEMLIKIPLGNTAGEIATLLKSSGLITSRHLFLLAVSITGSTKKLQSGTYRFRKNYNTLKILEMLVRGRTYSVRVTIPEGLTVRRTADIIEKAAALTQKQKEDFIENATRDKLEGYLFPETYFFPEGVTPGKIIEMMTGQFNRIFTQALQERADELRMSKHQVITLASIIEKEARVEEERKIVSAVFHNRLKKRWMLESCATVRYVLQKYEGPLTYGDLDALSPYNTYINYGLPPGPICSPGLSSIISALYPANTDLMFFFATGEGTHQFSKYYDEHLKGQKTRGAGKKRNAAVK
ncbi:MAG: endolytic transglycosylase MltG [Elusimicrobiota bacterium]